MLLPVLIAIGAGLAASACSSKTTPSTGTAPDAGTRVPKDAGDIDYIPSTDDVSVVLDADAPAETAVVTDSVTDKATPPDNFVEVGPDTAQGPAGCAAAFPLKGAVKFFAASPCGPNSVIMDLDDNGLGVCTDFQKPLNMVFQLGDGKILKTQPLDQVPDQIDGAPDGNIAITASDSKTYAGGILRLYGVTGTPNWLPFNPVTVDQKKFTPSLGKGIQFASAHFFVATGNTDFSKGNPIYFPGSVLAYTTGGVTFQALATKGLNATSIGTWKDAQGTHLAVVNTGPLDVSGNTSAKSRLAVFNTDIPALEQVFDLPFGGLGLAGELSIAGGRMAIPSADNSRRVLVLSTENLSATPQVVTVPNSSPEKKLHMIAFAKILGQYLVAGNYNTGLVSTWDLDGTASQVLGSTILLDNELKPGQGIADAACLGGKLLVTVGPNVMELQ